MIWKILAFAAFFCVSGCGGAVVTVQSAPATQQPKPISNVVAFMGDSITHRWDLTQYDAGPTMNFGVDENTTVQMLQRFSDVIANAPGVVVILGGINDIVDFEDGVSTAAPDPKSIEAMAAMAQAAGIRVILCSVTPTNYSSATAPLLGSTPSAVEEFNQQLIALAQANGYLYADYYDAMLDSAGAQNSALFTDAIHPNAAGYAVMWSVLMPLIAEDLN
jgi:lysophospholipase L1-like esterase